MTVRSWLATDKDAVVTQPERLSLLARLLQSAVGRLAGSHQVADRRMAFVRNPHLGQVARSVQARQAYGIQAGCFHPIARTSGHKGWRDHHAVMPQFDNLIVKAVAGRACFVAKVKLGSAEEMSPKNRTSPFHAQSAAATKIFSLGVFKPTKFTLPSFKIRPR